MTMQSSGPISIGQARNETHQGNPINAGNAGLQRLAGANGRLAWSWWYGKSFGVSVLEAGTQYYTVDYTGANNANFGRGLYIDRGGGFNAFSTTGGDTTVTGNYPAGPTNGFNISGFYRSGTTLTVIAGNCSLDGVTFTSSIGDNVRLTNDRSISRAFGPNLWTFYGMGGAVGQGAPRNYVVNLVGTAQRPQPPAGYVNGQPPAPPPTDTGGGGGGGSCFVAGSLVLMADQSWKQIQTLEPGDVLMTPTGPARMERLHVAKLGEYRRMMMFAEDPRHMWSEEHPHWGKQDGSQYWWAEGHQHLIDEMRSGMMTGLKDVDRILKGRVQYAHLDGFVERTPVPVIGADPETLVFVPVLNGPIAIVDGYLVGAFIDEWKFDYTSFDWNQHVTKFQLESHYLKLNKKWVKEYHDYFDTLMA